MIQGTYHAFATAVEDMGINHRGSYILVPKQFLNSPNIITIFEQVGRKAVTKSVAACVLADTGSH